MPGYFRLFLFLLNLKQNHLVLPVSERKRNSVFLLLFFKIVRILVGQLLFILNLKNNHPVDTADQSVKIR